MDLIQSIPIEADKPRNLRFGVGAVVRLERVYNKPITQILGDLQEQARSKQMCLGLLVDVLVAGLQHEDPTLTAETFAEALSIPQLVSLVPAIGAAITAAFPPPKEDLPNVPEQPIA